MATLGPAIRDSATPGTRMQTSLEIIGGMLTPIIAVVATYIAYQQWKTNQFKVRQDLFDRRFNVFQTTMNFLAVVLSEGKLADEVQRTFATKINEASLLLGEEMRLYLDEIRRRAERVAYIERRLGSESNRTPDELKRLGNESDDLRKWLAAQFEGARLRFAKQLAVADGGGFLKRVCRRQRRGHQVDHGNEPSP